MPIVWTTVHYTDWFKATYQSETYRGWDVYLQLVECCEKRMFGQSGEEHIFEQLLVSTF